MSPKPAGAAARRELLASLPDTPILVETRSLLLDPESDLWLDAGSGGFAVRERREGLAAVYGACAPELVRAAVSEAGPGWTLVSPIDRADELAAALPGWGCENATIFSLPRDRVPKAPPPAGARLVDARAVGPLDHLPAGLRSEIELALSRRRHLVAVRVDGLAVAFAYAYRQTESLWDVSIDTLAGHRRRGLAAACACLLIERQRRRGREPVWGATASNRASLALAEKLGFERCGALAVWALEIGNQ